MPIDFNQRIVIRNSNDFNQITNLLKVRKAFQLENGNWENNIFYGSYEAVFNENHENIYSIKDNISSPDIVKAEDVKNIYFEHVKEVFSNNFEEINNNLALNLSEEFIKKLTLDDYQKLIEQNEDIQSEIECDISVEEYTFIGKISENVNVYATNDNFGENYLIVNTNLEKFQFDYASKYDHDENIITDLIDLYALKYTDTDLQDLLNDFSKKNISQNQSISLGR